jgi:hypothetical protein
MLKTLPYYLFQCFVKPLFDLKICLRRSYTRYEVARVLEEKYLEYPSVGNPVDLPLSLYVPINTTQYY